MGNVSWDPERHRVSGVASGFLLSRGHSVWSVRVGRRAAVFRAEALLSCSPVGIPQEVRVELANVRDPDALERPRVTG